MLQPEAMRDLPPAAAGAKGRTWLWSLLAALAGAVLGLIFLAYLRPAFLIDFLNLRYCG